MTRRGSPIADLAIHFLRLAFLATKFMKITLRVCLLIVTFGVLLYFNTLTQPTLMTSTTKTTEKSDFDNWLIDGLGVKAVPSYVIFDGCDVIGVVSGFDDFEAQYEKIIADHEVIVNVTKVPNEVYLIRQEKKTKLTEMLNEITVLEVLETNHPKCKNPKMKFQYYMKSNLEDILKSNEGE